jgi:7,8-dihydropterin-6-yl-methyl-4-(beta-D-ribofuranosyl)aminobenzene 5'-phosphate synthase
MNIFCLIEDTQIDHRFGAEHGVSFYIETKHHKVLFDVGQSSLFISNAIHADIDLSLVDILVISHGHYDHGGGLEDFLRVNKHAKIYVQESIFNKFYSMRKLNEYTYIGLNPTLYDKKRFIKLKGDYKIDDELMIIAEIKGKAFFPNSNHTMFKKELDHYVLDDFKHEQSLIVNENQKVALFAGCGHKGILNIINQVEEQIRPLNISHVFGGFHLKSRFEAFRESSKHIDDIADIMKNKRIDMYYTGHCTGSVAYDQMKKILDTRLACFHPGVKINL